MRTESLWAKLQLCWYFLRQYNSCAIMQCPFCGSIDVKKTWEYGDKNGRGRIYAARHVCQKCGAVCEEKQTWVAKD